MSAADLPPDIAAAVPELAVEVVLALRTIFGPRPAVSARSEAPDDIPPEHVITDRVGLPPAAYEAVVEPVKNPPPPTPALVACMARCEALAPEEHAQAGARCEREPHPTPNHKVAPRDGLPGAVWSDARSRDDGGS